MTVRLTLEVELLRNPVVAQALQRLVLELAQAYGGAAPAIPAPAIAAAPAPRAAAPARASTSYAEFEAGLNGRTRRFLELLRERGTLTLSEVMSSLDIDSPKAVGGTTGAIGRWAPVRGLALPYEVIEVGGERAWRWTGPEEVAAAEPAERPAPAARTPRARKAVTTAVAAPAPDPEQLRGEFVESLSDQPRRFMDLLRDKRRVAVAEVLDHLGLARAKGLSSVVEAINAAARSAGLDRAYDTSVSATGDRVFLWPGTPAEVEEARPRLRVESPSPRVLALREAPTSQGPAPLRPDAPTSAGAPGVFKRNKAKAT
jgi:hypothetical protein